MSELLENSVIRHIINDWAEGNMSYSLIAKLKELKDQGLIEDSYNAEGANTVSSFMYTVPLKSSEAQTAGL